MVGNDLKIGFMKGNTSRLARGKVCISLWQSLCPEMGTGWRALCRAYWGDTQHDTGRGGEPRAGQAEGGAKTQCSCNRAEEGNFHLPESRPLARCEGGVTFFGKWQLPG